MTVADCPASAKDFYENVPIVYTWVDGEIDGTVRRKALLDCAE